METWKYWQDVEQQAFHSLLVEREMVQPLSDTVWQFLTKLRTGSPYDPATALVVSSPKELKMCAHTKSGTQMFIATLFLIVKT